ncbi:hypothetical protein HOLleu_12474 [Holothuria leucospilota]|uniref:Uncharacterized protein n=1 Tax=Holothuria leucospilota TaxID=206669 RepID=A0A9Q1HA52_HOLLE|nr:hypothetical protein HOLleu_12474 [Holothuria leucospilota]
MRKGVILQEDVDLSAPPQYAQTNATTQTETDETPTPSETSQTTETGTATTIAQTAELNSPSTSRTQTEEIAQPPPPSQSPSTSQIITGQSTSTVISENPLVKYGIVSEELAAIFFPPKEDIPQGRKQALRMKSKARVMTADEVLEDIEKQKKELEEKQRKKEERLKERERKKAEKEKQEAEKRKRKEEAEARKKAKNEKTKSMKQLNVTETVPVQEDSDDDQEDDFCSVCSKDFCDDPPEEQEQWVGCSRQGCHRWSCTECLPENFDYANDFFCQGCVASLVEEPVVSLEE